MYFDPNLNRIVIEKINGDLYVNNYKIVQHVATGSFCKVYKVISNNGNNSQMAAMITSKYVDQIQKKVDIQQLLNNIDHIPKIYEYYIEPNVVYDNTDKAQQEIYEQLQHGVMFQQFLSYQPITNLICKVSQHEHVYKRIYLFLQLVQTMLRIHECGVYHLDLKPENIVVSEDDYYVIDFGSAQYVEQSDDYKIMDTCVSENQKATVVYNITPSYSSFKYDQQNGLLLCEKYDAYSLGCILYYFIMNEDLHKPLSQQQDKCKQICDEYGYIIFDLILGLTNQDPVLRYSLKECINHPVFYPFQSQETNSFYSNKVSEEIKDFLKGKSKDFFYALPMRLQIKLIYQFRLYYTISLRQQMQNNVKRCKLFKQRSKSVQNPRMKKSKHSYDDFDMKYYSDFIRYHEYNYPCTVVVENTILHGGGSSNNILDWEQNCSGRKVTVNKIIQSYKRYFQLFFWSHQCFQALTDSENDSPNSIYALNGHRHIHNESSNTMLFSISKIQLKSEQSELTFDSSLMSSFMDNAGEEISQDFSETPDLEIL